MDRDLSLIQKKKVRNSEQVKLNQRRVSKWIADHLTPQRAGLAKLVSLDTGILPTQWS